MRGSIRRSSACAKATREHLHQALREVHRVLKAGGRFVLSDPVASRLLAIKDPVPKDGDGCC